MRCRSKAAVQVVSARELRQVIDRYAPRGLFLAREGRGWTAVDNSTGHAWTEEFRRKGRAVRWLRGESEIVDTDSRCSGRSSLQ